MTEDKIMIKLKRPHKDKDLNLSWASTLYPGDLDGWVSFAKPWINLKSKERNKRSDTVRCSAMVYFLEKYLIKTIYPINSSVLIVKQYFESNKNNWPIFHDIIAHNNRKAIYTNIIYEFLVYILKTSHYFGVSYNYDELIDIHHLTGKSSLARKQLDNHYLINCEHLFSWISRDYPKFSKWEQLFSLWFNNHKRVANIETRLYAIKHFFEIYLVKHIYKFDNSVIDPMCFLSKKWHIEYHMLLPKHSKSIKFLNSLHEILNYAVKIYTKDGKEPKEIFNPMPIIGFTRHSNEFYYKKYNTLCDIFLIKHSKLEEWILFLEKWIKSSKYRAQKIQTLRRSVLYFLEKYIIKNYNCISPADFLEKKVKIHDYVYANYSTNPEKNVAHNNALFDYFEYIIRNEVGIADGKGMMVRNTSFSNPITLYNRKNIQLEYRRNTNGKSRIFDTTFEWLYVEHNDLKDWQELFVGWIKLQKKVSNYIASTFVYFVKNYLTKLVSYPTPTPKAFLSRNNNYPDFFTFTKLTNSARDIRLYNQLFDFLEYVLASKFSLTDEYNRRTVSPDVHNPLIHKREYSVLKHDSSVRSTLPYSHLDSLRKKLCQGETFRDWVWAQNAMGREGENYAPDWFSVSENIIDFDDKNCVFRERKKLGPDGKTNITITELWSPVRWVALLIKLILPLRTYQCRVLDSGEGDTWRCVLKNMGEVEWVLNSNKIFEKGTIVKPRQNGVLRRVRDVSRNDRVELYINTNKTADSKLIGKRKGFIMPWSLDLPYFENPFFWLSKLRDWQEKYNPVMNPCKWSQIPPEIFGMIKSEMQLASHVDTFFLFRQAESREFNNKCYPITDSILDTAWYKLLFDYENELKFKGNPLPFPLVYPGPDRKTYFPLHSLRVSLVTCLVYEGKLPIEIMQKIIGHSRLLMTLYYAVPKYGDIVQEIAAALKKMKEDSKLNTLLFLQNATFSELREQKYAIINDVDSIPYCFQKNPNDRSAAGYVQMKYGYCLVGANTSDDETYNAIHGCHDGGPLKKRNKNGKLWHDPVPGGKFNCCRCRWFATGIQFIRELLHYCQLTYKETLECWEKSEYYINKSTLLRNELLHDENIAGVSDKNKNDSLKSYENAAEEYTNLFVENMANLASLWLLKDKCIESLKWYKNNDDKCAIVTIGSLYDVKVACEYTNSKFHEIAHLCLSSEELGLVQNTKDIYYLRIKLAPLLHEIGTPFTSIDLPDEEWQKLCNVLIRDISCKADPKNPDNGLRLVSRHIDNGHDLLELLGKDFNTIRKNLASTGKLLSITSGSREESDEN